MTDCRDAIQTHSRPPDSLVQWLSWPSPEFMLASHQVWHQFTLTLLAPDVEVRPRWVECVPPSLHGPANEDAWTSIAGSARELNNCPLE